MQISKRDFLKRLGALAAAGTASAACSDEFVAVRGLKGLPPGAIGEPRSRIRRLAETLADAEQRR